METTNRGTLYRVLAGITLAVLIAGIAVIWFSQTHPGQAVGAVQFGGGYDSSLAITNPHSAFYDGETVVYSANLPGGAGTMALDISVVQELQGGAERVLAALPMAISDPTNDLVAGKLTGTALAAVGVKPGGSYVLRIFRGSTKLAEGAFIVSR